MLRLLQVLVFLLKVGWVIFSLEVSLVEILADSGGLIARKEVNRDVVIVSTDYLLVVSYVLQISLFVCLFVLLRLMRVTDIRVLLFRVSVVVSVALA